MLAAFVWVMIGIAIWHFTVLFPDRFCGGIIGAFLTAVLGAVVTGFLLPNPGFPPTNPPGLGEALWPIPGSLLALALSYWYGSKIEERRLAEEQ